eukprot:5348278-Prymnesium_polylepis.1
MSRTYVIRAVHAMGCGVNSVWNEADTRGAQQCATGGTSGGACDGGDARQRKPPDGSTHLLHCRASPGAGGSRAQKERKAAEGREDRSP